MPSDAPTKVPRDALVMPSPGVGFQNHLSEFPHAFLKVCSTGTPWGCQRAVQLPPAQRSAWADTLLPAEARARDAEAPGQVQGEQVRALREVICALGWAAARIRYQNLKCTCAP